MSTIKTGPDMFSNPSIDIPLAVKLPRFAIAGSLFPHDKLNMKLSGLTSKSAENPFSDDCPRKFSDELLRSAVRAFVFRLASITRSLKVLPRIVRFFDIIFRTPVVSAVISPWIELLSASKSPVRKNSFILSVLRKFTLNPSFPFANETVSPGIWWYEGIRLLREDPMKDLIPRRLKYPVMSASA